MAESGEEVLWEDVLDKEEQQAGSGGGAL